MKTTLHIALISLLLLSACPALAAVTGIRYDQPVAYTGTTPSLFISGPGVVAQGDSVQLYAHYDTDSGSTPFFYWQAAKGQLFNTASGVSVTWVPPANSEGETFAVSCIMGDGLGRETRAVTFISVESSPTGATASAVPPATCIVSAAEVSDGLQIKWERVRGITSWVAQASRASDFSSPITELNPSYHTTQVTFQNLASGDWFFRVRGVNNAGYGEWSEPYLGSIEDFAQALTPASPTPAAAATGVSRQPTLSWTTESGTGFRVVWGTSATNLENTLQTFGGANQLNTSVQFPCALAPNTTFYWQVLATDGNHIQAGPVWNFTTESRSADLQLKNIKIIGDAKRTATVRMEAEVKNVGNYAMQGRGVLKYFVLTQEGGGATRDAAFHTTFDPLNAGETAYISGSFPLDFDLADGNPAILGRVESVEAEESNVANNAVTVVPQLTDKEAPLVQYFALPVGDAQVYGHGVFYTFEFQINDDLTSRPEFRIDYSTDSGSSWNFIASGRTLKGGYGDFVEWEIPETVTRGSEVTLRMTARDLAGKTSTKTLTSFTVQDTISATFSITAPALGEVWEIGTTKTISWTYGDGPEPVQVNVLMNGDAVDSWSSGKWQISEQTQASAPTSYSWSIPNRENLVGDNVVLTIETVTASSIEAVVASPKISIVSDATQPVPWTNPSRIISGVQDLSPVSLVAGENNVKHLFYRSESNGVYSLIYRKYSGSSWGSAQTVIQSTAVPSEIKAVLDSAGRPHVLWVEQTSYDVRHTWLNGSSWAPITTLSTGDNFANKVDVAADADGNVHAVWCGRVSGVVKLVYAKYSAGSWSAPSNTEITCQIPSMAIDPDNNIHVVFSNDTGMSYTRLINGQWSTPLELTRDATSYNDFIITNDGRGYLAYYQSPMVRTMSMSNGVWSVPEVVSTQNGPLALLADHNQLPVLCWQNGGSLAIVRRSSAGWHTPVFISGAYDMYDAFDAALLSDGTLDVAWTSDYQGSPAIMESTADYSSSDSDALPPSTTASPAEGVYSSRFSVSLDSQDSGSGVYAIYYTTDGSTPTVNSAQYSAPIPVDGNLALRFFALDIAGNAEAVQTQTYRIDGTDTTPPVSWSRPGSGAYMSGTALQVALACQDTKGGSCSAIHYTTNGASPTTSSATYTTPLTLNSDTTLKFFAVDSDGNSETAKSASYLFVTDIDSDGLSDSFEMLYFDSLGYSDGSTDKDGDGLIESREFQLGSNPTLVDTDGDGFSDKVEAYSGSDPTNPASQPEPSSSPMPAVIQLLLN